MQTVATHAQNTRSFLAKGSFAREAPMRWPMPVSKSASLTMLMPATMGMTLEPKPE